MEKRTVDGGREAEVKKEERRGNEGNNAEKDLEEEDQSTSDVKREGLRREGYIILRRGRTGRGFGLGWVALRWAKKRKTLST
jgi:hypothetical protein